MNQAFRFIWHAVLLCAASAYTSSVDPNCPSNLTTPLSWPQYIPCAASMLDCYFPADSCFSDSAPFTANLTCLCANTAFITQVAVNVYYWCQCDHPGILALTAAAFEHNCSDSSTPAAYNESQITSIGSQTTLTCTTSTSSTSPAKSATDTTSTSAANSTSTSTSTPGSVININGTCVNINNQEGQNTTQGGQNMTCKSPESSGASILTPGGIAGVVIAAIVAVMTAIALWFAWKKHQREKREEAAKKEEEEAAKRVGGSHDNSSSDSASATPPQPATQQS